MPIKVAHSQKPRVEDAVAEVAGQLGSGARLVLYFASPAHDPGALAAAMQRAAGPARTLGCTTAGELVTGKTLQGSIVAMGLGEDIVEDVSIAVAPGIDKNAGPAVGQALARFEQHFKQKPSALDRDRHVGFVLTDGLSVAEEAVMERLSDATNVTFIGGSSGDDLKFQRTWVFADGEAATNASALGLIRAGRPFEILKTQSFRVLDKRLVATRVDEKTRTVLEFDGKPAAEAYASALGTTVANLPSQFQRHPLGLMVSATEPFVRSPMQVKGGAVVFYCMVQEGMELRVLESGDIVKDTRAAVEARFGSPPQVKGLINFHCILRTLQLQATGQMEAYGQAFRDVPMIGFSTYGESYIGHINQTSTMLAFR